MSANPPLVNARTRFSVEADWWYACSSRWGSACRAAAENAMSLTMCPRNDGSSTPSMVSVADDLGLANCPAIRPTFTTGTPAE